MDVDTQKPNKYSSEYHTVYLSRSNKTSKQDFQSIESNDDNDNSSESEAIVYISDLPLNIEDDVQLHRLIETRLEKTFQIIPISVQCYPKLGVGFMCVRNNDIKNRLVNDIQRIVLDSTRDTSLISFNDTIEIISYIVIDITNEKNDIDLPKPNEIRNRWIDLYHGEKSISCEQISVQFPNIYRIISYSFDDLLNAMSNRDFLINNLIARVYIAADCSYFEDLPKSTTKEQLEKAICSSIGKQNISSLSLYIELNKQTNNACIIATDQARSWSTKSFLYLNDKPMSKKENLTCRLLIHPISDIHNDVDEILDEKIFDGQATIIERRDKNLVLEISNKKIYDNCLTVGVLSIKDKPRLKMEVYTTLNNPEDQEIDLDTWYQYDMIRYKPDIMQFIVDLDHPIFRYKWNPDIWFEQFQNSKPQNHSTNFNSRHHSNLSSDKIRHLLQMTVMLNTIGVIRKKSYFIKNKQINLHLNPKLKTIIYNHDSLLEHGQTVQLTTTPYTETKVKVINEDCVTVYGNCCKDYKKPLLLNMANATSPGGGYRKGDGAQEENLFRRSDYFRSLDVELDHIYEETSERFVCSSDGQILPLHDYQSMYPIDEYGAIYTSGLTFFRKSEQQGYDYMEQPLENVYSLAIAAYRNPKLDGNMLSPQYSVGMRKKIENLFSIAYNHKHDCLILSALGCGAFRNPPEHVAKIFRSVIEQYAGFFQTIIFAILDDHNTGQQHNPEGNFKSFRNELHDQIFRPILSLNDRNTITGPYRISLDSLAINDVMIFDLEPCHFGAKCNDMYDRQHAQKYSHPSLCKQQCLKGMCDQTNDLVHSSSFIHRNPCKYGAQCKDIDNEKHSQEYEHPSWCPNGGHCQDTSEEHEKSYRHLPTCKHFQKCLDYKRHDKNHCGKFRHYTPSCIYGSYCVNFHDQQHIEDYKHPFPYPCPFTPYHCETYEKFIMSKDPRQLKDEINQHCLNYSHVCAFGRNCTDKDPLHWEKYIHVPRCLCPYGNQCTKLVQEEHLNSFTHPKIRDIRFLCKYADKCYDRRKPEHLSRFRHIITFEDSGIVRYFNLNKDIDFVQNQHDNIKRVNNYIKKEKWETFKSGSIPQNIIDWICTVQPVHRCRREIFESILLHGHVMSRDYMEQLRFPEKVVTSVFQHSEIRRIQCLKERNVAQHVREYIEALVNEEFAKKRYEVINMDETQAGNQLLSSEMDTMKSREDLIKSKEVILSNVISLEEINTIKTKAIEIAQASIKLHSNPAGIGYERDKDLGTNKSVFSVLGPHLGHYYGDVFIVFKREILHHPDANFSLQAATSYASGNCFSWRPWLRSDSTSNDDGVNLFHKTKLHAAITGYEYATALELIAMMSQSLKKKSMNINLDTILKHWLTRDSHTVIEAHLPQLIPLDYIDHIYMSQNIFDSLSTNTRKFIDVTFKGRITKTSHEIELDRFEGPFGPKPDSKIRIEYQDFVIKDIIEKYGQRDIHSISRPIQGTIITIPSSDLTDHYVLPITISQAYKQYKVDYSNVSSDDIPFYIYWQVMNGDMMLTLSNEQINTGKQQPNLRCLISYIAEKPSTKDFHYHENESYLYNGRPFQHEFVINGTKYAIKSRSFYIGCNTDDFMTFCLEIQRSTGKVILSHAGPNSIYNHEQISSTFSKSDLDLNQLNYIHVSARARTVPIRNVFVTFEKQPKPLDETDSNVQLDSSGLPDNSSDNNNTTILSTKDTVNQQDQSSGKTYSSML
ncbi:unnamed protein product [Rotaria sp. Silwood1]|nr:unnamed protein product [Rotaria sp. Silwood1]